MAESEYKIISVKKAKRAMLRFIANATDKEDGGPSPCKATIDWYIDNSLAKLNTQYNNLANDVFWKTYNLHLCIIDTAGNVKQYSTYYDRLTKFNPSWVGFYPSVYTVSETIDMEGNTQDKTIKDMDELKELRNKKKADKFYFAGLKYNLSDIKLKHPTNDDWGWEAFGNCKEAMECIYIRKTKNHYTIVNYGLQGTKTRQDYGSESTVANGLSKFIKKNLLDEDADSMYFEEVEDAIGLMGF